MINDDILNEIKVIDKHVLVNPATFEQDILIKVKTPFTLLEYALSGEEKEAMQAKITREILKQLFELESI